MDSLFILDNVIVDRAVLSTLSVLNQQRGYPFKIFSLLMTATKNVDYSSCFTSIYIFLSALEDMWLFLMMATKVEEKLVLVR